MKNALPCILLAISCLSAGAQIPVPADSLYHFIQHNNIHHNSIDWRQVDAGFYARLRAAQMDTDLHLYR